MNIWENELYNLQNLLWNKFTIMAKTEKLQHGTGVFTGNGNSSVNNYSNGNNGNN